MDEFSPISPMGEEDSVKPADKRKKKKKKKKSGSVRKGIAIRNLLELRMLAAQKDMPDLSTGLYDMAMRAKFKRKHSTRRRAKGGLKAKSAARRTKTNEEIVASRMKKFGKTFRKRVALSFKKQWAARSLPTSSSSDRA
jgi:hypothetical protein